MNGSVPLPAQPTSSAFAALLKSSHRPGTLDGFARSNAISTLRRGLEQSITGSCPQTGCVTSGLS